MKKRLLFLILITVLSFCGCMASGRQNAGDDMTPANTSALYPAASQQPSSGSSNSTITDSPETADGTTQTKNPEVAAPITVDEVSDAGTFYLGQSYGDISSILYDRGIEILQGTDDALNTDGFGFSFYKGKAYEIYVDAPSKIPTVKGLDFGDSVDRMTELYGTDYKRWAYAPECVVYEYTIGDHYFQVQFLNGKVDSWILMVNNTNTTTGTSETEAESTPIIVNELTDDGEGTFYIGQPLNDVRQILQDRKIEIQDDVDITISTEKFGFEFDNKNELLVDVTLTAASETPTVSGLDFGDSYEKMTELYGSDYTEKVLGPEASTYEYEIGDHYFYVRIFQGAVNMWGIRIDYTQEGPPY